MTVPLPLPPSRGPKKGRLKTICRRFQRFIVLSRTDRQTASAARAVGPHHWHLGHGTRPNPVPGSLPGAFGPASDQHLRQLPAQPPPSPLPETTNKLKGEKTKTPKDKEEGAPLLEYEEFSVSSYPSAEAPLLPGWPPRLSMLPNLSLLKPASPSPNSRHATRWKGRERWWGWGEGPSW